MTSELEKIRKINKQKQNFLALLIFLLGIFLSLILFIYLNQEKRTKLVVNKLQPENGLSGGYVLRSRLYGQKIYLDGQIRGGIEVDLIAGAKGFVNKSLVEIGKKVNRGQNVARLTEDLEGKKFQTFYTDPYKLVGSKIEQERYFFRQMANVKEKARMLRNLFGNIGGVLEFQSSLAGRKDLVIYNIKKRERDIKRGQRIGQKIIMDKVLVANWVISPLSGIITKKNISEGQAVDIGDLLMTVSDTSKMMASFDLDRKYYNNISFGLNVDINLVDTGERLAGIITSIQKDDLSVSGLSRVDVSINSIIRPELIGKKIKVEVGLLAKPVYFLPKDFILKDDLGSYAFINGQKVRLEIVSEEENQVIINFDGIKDGMIVTRAVNT